jgi:hypothetical protein
VEVERRTDIYFSSRLLGRGGGVSVLLVMESTSNHPGCCGGSGGGVTQFRRRDRKPGTLYTLWVGGTGCSPSPSSRLREGR